jgi:Uma2 family endonuclease
MAIATQRFTLAEYFDYDDGRDGSYELVNGELIPMTLGMGIHGEIADFLHSCFRGQIKNQGLPWVSKQMVIGIQSPRGDRWDTLRIPDVTVLPRCQWQELQNREAVICLNEPAPMLVVEVVSESTKSTDYRAKRAEYSVLEIPEYWIVDPLIGKITVLQMLEGWYDATEFMGQDLVQSPTFPQIQLSVEEIFQGEL